MRAESRKMEEEMTKGMSEYERERQKRIEENRKMLEELFPDGTSLSVPVVRRASAVKEGTPESKDGDSTFGSPVTPRTRARSVTSSYSPLSLLHLLSVFFQHHTIYVPSMMF